MDISDESAGAGGSIPTLRTPRRTLVVLAGLPGAGKSTVLHKLIAPSGTVVLDSEQVRARLKAVLPAAVPYRWYRPLVHALHRMRIAWFCLSADGRVIAHEPSTRATTRLMLVLFALISGRRRVLVWLHVGPEEALAGQHARGRLIRSRAFQLHVHRAYRVHRELLAGRGPHGWQDVRLFTRNDLAGGLRVTGRR
ncbi:AAA family ATPase [Saccharopolyspora gloriosae]|uniref:AAA family ATPase n=1 Tax=Saccharopolyspora gloriosae TaxID=455344 RepID=UPI001FB75AA1|nr:AAA family ATPase [Saccharopolyspora gloriosae]